jgi:hypothetical protein
MGRAAQDAAARVAAAVTDDLEYGERLSAWRGALREEFPDWQCWNVRLYVSGTDLWCARPAGSQDASRNVYGDSAEQLAGRISAVITGVAP